MAGDATPNQASDRFGGTTGAIASGVVTTCVLAGVIFFGADWFHRHLSHPQASLWVDPIFYVVQTVLALLPGVLVGLVMYRRNTLLGDLGLQKTAAETARSELARTNRALKALSGVNHELIRATDQEALLARICQVMVELSGYDLVWVALAEPGDDKCVRIAARAGEAAPWLEALGIRHDTSPYGQGPTGTAIRDGRVVVEPSFAEAAFFRQWPQRPRELEQYTSGASFPLRVEGRVLGALTIYERHQRELGLEELELLTQMADDVSYGLRFLSLSAARDRARARLHQSLRISSAMAATAQELVAGNLGLPEIALLVLEQARQLTASSFGAVGLTDRRTGRLGWLAVSPALSGASWRHDACEIYPDDTGRFSGPFAETLNSGQSVCRNTPVSLSGPCACRCLPDEAQRLLTVPLRNPDRTPAGLILLTDAPEPFAKRDARALVRLAVLLDMARARRLVEDDLMIARRQAEAASQAKTQFLSNVSHELRTPINGILGMAQLAVLEGVSGREAEYWQTVRESTDRLMALVDNLIELANVESGSLSPQLREFSLRRMVDSLRTAFSVRSALAGLALTIEVDTELPDRLLGDPFRLRQILANLLDNAIRFTPSGSVTLRASRLGEQLAGPARRVFVSGDFAGVSLLFAVSDTGVGIAPDKQESIFESFTLAEDCLTKRFGGSGMGLAIARRLAELLGGSIWVESQPGFGSTFYLSAPLWPAAKAAEQPAKSVGHPALPDSLTFLVVEDEAVNRLALARGLRKLGHVVIEAGNGEEALRQLTAQRVDAVIMDIQMPVMDGLTTLAHIRNGEVPGTNRDLPVVALTAYALDGDRKRFLDAGMDEFVTKPCDMDQLLEAVALAMGLRQSA